MPAEWQAYPLNSTPARRHTCLPSDQRTFAKAPAQHCRRACRTVVSKPAEEHPRVAARVPAKGSARSLASTRAALHTCLQNDERSCSRAPAQHCRHASTMQRTPAQEHPRSTPHACQMMSTPAQEHPRSTAQMPAN